MSRRKMCFGVLDRAGYLRSEYLVWSRADAERAASLEWGSEPVTLSRYPANTWGYSSEDKLMRSFDLTTNEGWAAL